jgi:hypothetical protein
MKLALLIALALAAQPPRDRAPQSSPGARASIDRFGRCAAQRSPAYAAETLARDFTTHTYRSALRNLARANEGCFGQRRGRMRSADLLFAGALAEGLLAADPTPLNARLARAATRPAIPALSGSDLIAICVVRSVPDDVARLFATPVASEGETAALASLEPALAACNGTGQAFDVSGPGRRAILATAAFRTVRAAQAPAASGN